MKDIDPVQLEEELNSRVASLAEALLLDALREGFTKGSLEAVMEGCWHTAVLFHNIGAKVIEDKVVDFLENA